MFRLEISPAVAAGTNTARRRPRRASVVYRLEDGDAGCYANHTFINGGWDWDAPHSLVPNFSDPEAGFYLLQFDDYSWGRCPVPDIVRALAALQQRPVEPIWEAR